MRATMALLLFMGSTSSSFAQVKTEDQILGEAMATTIKVLETEHLQRIPIDDRISRRWFQKFFEGLDPRRMYFLEEDLREFHAYESRLDDLGRAGDISFPRQIGKRFQKRVKEATDFAKLQLYAPHDYMIEENAPQDYDYFAIDEEARKERWRLRIKCELLIEKSIRRPNEEVRKQFTQRYDRLFRQARDLSHDRLQSRFLHALGRSVDPHNYYFSDELIWALSPRWRSPTLPLSFDPNSHRNLINGVWPQVNELRGDVIGFELLAIQTTSGKIIDVVEMPSLDFLRLPWLRMCDNRFEGEVVLQLWNPLTLERKDASYPLYQNP